MVQVDEDARPHEAHRQRRDEALATGDRLRVLPAVCECGERLGERFRLHVRERRRLHVVLAVNQAPDARRRERQLHVVPPERVRDGVRDRDWRGHRVALAETLRAERRKRRGRREVPDARHGQVGRRRRQVVDQRARHQVPGFVVDVALEERCADTVRETAEDLAVRERRIEQHAGVVHGHVVRHAHGAGLAIDLDGADVDDEAVGARRGDAILAIRRIEVRCRPEGDRRQSGLHLLGQALGVPVGHPGHLAQRELGLADVLADRVDLRADPSRGRLDCADPDPEKRDE